MKSISILSLIAMFAILSSCSNGGKENEKAATDSTAVSGAVNNPMKVMMVVHPVKDFGKWKEVYLSHDSVRKAYGITSYMLGRGLDDSNVVYVMNKMDDVQKAKEFGSLPNLKETMEKAGVSGPPVFYYTNVIRNDDSPIQYSDRVMVIHHVKDFDAWLKVYDQEGKETRAANGMIDRGMGRSMDDPNTVSLVFAISDMAKAKARFGSEDLKKIMTDAGVDGPPTIYFYHVVN